MPGMKKQVLSNAIDILINQGNLPEKNGIKVQREQFSRLRINSILMH